MHLVWRRGIMILWCMVLGRLRDGYPWYETGARRFDMILCSCDKRKAGPGIAGGSLPDGEPCYMFLPKGLGIAAGHAFRGRPLSDI